MQQTGEQVVDGYKQGHGCHDVIGFTAADNILGLPHDETTHQQHKQTRNRYSQHWHLEENSRQTHAECHQNADKQECAEAHHVWGFGRSGIS